MKQRASIIGAASPIKIWLQRFAFVLLLTIAFMTLLVGKADTVAVSRARMALIDGLAPLLDAVATPILLGPDDQSAKPISEEGMVLV